MFTQMKIPMTGRWRAGRYSVFGVEVTPATRRPFYLSLGYLLRPVVIVVAASLYFHTSPIADLDYFCTCIGSVMNIMDRFTR
jgi:hypothetical protein